jgi:hypothetical protein
MRRKARSTTHCTTTKITEAITRTMKMDDVALISKRNFVMVSRLTVSDRSRFNHDTARAVRGKAIRQARWLRCANVPKRT